MHPDADFAPADYLHMSPDEPINVGVFTRYPGVMHALTAVLTECAPDLRSNVRITDFTRPTDRAYIETNLVILGVDTLDTPELNASEMRESVDADAHNAYNLSTGGRRMTFREIEKILLANGWAFTSAKGSHYQYEHPAKPGKVTVPYHKGDLNIKTANAILKQAGISKGG